MEAQTVALSGADELFVVNAIAESRQKIEAKEFDAALQIIASVYDAGSALDRVPLDGLKADCFLGLGNLDEALECYERILAVQPDAPYWVHVGFANVLERMSQPEAAIEKMLVALRKEFSLGLA